MKKRSSKHRVVFSFKRFFVLLLLVAIAIFINNQKIILASKDIKAQSVVSIKKPLEKNNLNVSQINNTESSSEEVSVLKNDILNRISEAKKNAEIDNGKLFVDETYGGQLVESESEMPIANLSIPALDFERQIWRGVGASENGLAGFGDDDRLYKAVTYRHGQTLGGDNFTIVSHVWNGFSYLGQDYSKEWFSPLLTSKDGGMTTDISKLKLQKGDDIVVTENSTGYIFTFKIVEIKTLLHSKSDGTITEEVKQTLLPRVNDGVPRITLQGCLLDTDQLLFIVGELKAVRNQQFVYEFQS